MHIRKLLTLAVAICALPLVACSKDADDVIWTKEMRLHEVKFINMHFAVTQISMLDDGKVYENKFLFGGYHPHLREGNSVTVSYTYSRTYHQYRYRICTFGEKVTCLYNRE